MYHDLMIYKRFRNEIRAQKINQNPKAFCTTQKLKQN